MLYWVSLLYRSDGVCISVDYRSEGHDDVLFVRFGRYRVCFTGFPYYTGVMASVYREE